jgi:hypothetical protein
MKKNGRMGEWENGRMGEGVREIHANLHPATCNMHPSNYL